MPIYEYKCAECGNSLEAMQKISDEPLTVCPKCSGKLEKQWSRTGFQFKGTGWYVTDYANRGAESPSENKTEGAAKSSEGGGKTETTSDGGGSATAKPAAAETVSAKESTGKSDAASKTETKTIVAD